MNWKDMEKRFHVNNAMNSLWIEKYSKSTLSPCIQFRNHSHVSFAERVKTHSAQERKSCQYCDISTENKESIQSHMIEAHEEYVVLYTMASQVDSLKDSYDGFDKFRDDVTSTLKTLLNNQNVMQQKLFLLRNIEAEKAKIRSSE